MLFFWYPSGYKCYKLLDHETNFVIITRQVVFQDELFLFVESELSQEHCHFFPDLTQHPPMKSVIAGDDPSSSSPFVEIVSSANLITDDLEPSVKTSHWRTTQPSYLQNYYCHLVKSSTIHEIS